jgi:hypothetical protein
MRSLDSLDFAPSAPNHNSPLMELESAVEIGTALDVEKHKQMEHMVIQDQCNKNFAN